MFLPPVIVGSPKLTIDLGPILPYNNQVRLLYEVRDMKSLYVAPELTVEKYEINEQITALDASGVATEEDKGGYGPIIP